MPFGASESPWKSFIHQLYYKHGWIAVSGKAVRLDYMHIFYWCLLVLTTIETLCVTKYASMDLYLTRIGAHASPSISAAAAQALSMYHMWYSIGVVLLLVFWVDMWMKVTCFGWKWYWSSDVFNIIDLCSNVLSVLCLLAERLRFLEMLLYHPTTIHMLCDTANVHRHNQSLDGDGAGLDTTGCSVSLDTKKYLATRLSSIFAFCMALRLFRLVRIFQFTALYEKAASAFSAYGVIFRLLYFFFSMVYVFAIIGQDIFGHVLVQDNTNLRGTGWWPFRSVLNYSSFMPAFNTVFNLITLASWTVVMDAAVKATSPLACVYFFACRFVGELLFLPLFIGYILDVIVKEFADWDVRMGKVDAYTNYSNSNRNDRTNNSNRSYTINNNAFFQVELGNRDIDSSL